jgi:hypothetical protein
MRTRAIGRRTGRAIFVLAVAVALGGGTAAAYAEVTWEFAGRRPWGEAADNCRDRGAGGDAVAI